MIQWHLSFQVIYLDYWVRWRYNLNWRLYLDGTVNDYGNGVRAVSISPKRNHYLVAVKLKFPSTKKLTEYEANIIALHASFDMKVKDLEVYENYPYYITSHWWVGNQNSWARKVPQMPNASEGHVPIHFFHIYARTLWLPWHQRWKSMIMWQ